MSRGLDVEHGDTRGDAWRRGPEREPVVRDPTRRSFTLPAGRFALPSDREREIVPGRDRSYRLRETESHTLATVGIFHVVFDRDLREGRYRGEPARLDEDIKALRGQGACCSPPPSPPTTPTTATPCASSR